MDECRKDMQSGNSRNHHNRQRKRRQLFALATSILICAAVLLFLGLWSHHPTQLPDEVQVIAEVSPSPQQQRLENLEKENAQLRAELDLFEEELDQQTDLVETLQGQLSVLEATDSAQELLVLQRTLRDKQQLVQEMDAGQRALQLKLEESHQKALTLENALRTLQKLSEAKEEEYKAIKTQLKGEIPDKYREQALLLQKELQKQVALNQELRQKFDASLSLDDLTQLKEELSRTREEKAKVEKAHTELQEKGKALSDTFKQLKAYHTQQEEVFAKEKELRRNLEEENAENEELLETLKREHQALVQHHAQLKQDYEKVNDSLFTLKEDLTRRDQQELALKEIQEEHTQLKQRHARLTTLYDQERKKGQVLLEKTKQLSEIEKQRTLWQQKYQQLHEEQKKQEGLLSAEEIAALEEERDDLYKEVQELLEAYSLQKERLSQEVRKRLNLEAQLENSTLQRQGLQDKLETLQKHVDTLEQQVKPLQDIEQKMTILEKENLLLQEKSKNEEKAKEKTSVLEKENQTLQQQLQQALVRVRALEKGNLYLQEEKKKYADKVAKAQEQHQKYNQHHQELNSRLQDIRLTLQEKERQYITLKQEAELLNHRLQEQAKVLVSSQENKSEQRNRDLEWNKMLYEKAQLEAKINLLEEKEKSWGVERELRTAQAERIQLLSNEIERLKKKVAEREKEEKARSLARNDEDDITRIHLVSNGESLTEIAVRYYGDARRWVDVYEANTTKIPDRDHLRIGTPLVIP